MYKVGCTYIHVYIHTYIHDILHTYIHTCTHTYIHTVHMTFCLPRTPKKCTDRLSSGRMQVYMSSNRSKQPTFFRVGAFERAKEGRRSPFPGRRCKPLQKHHKQCACLKTWPLLSPPDFPSPHRTPSLYPIGTAPRANTRPDHRSQVSPVGTFPCKHPSPTKSLN
jgi:hypothetical protein